MNENKLKSSVMLRMIITASLGLFLLLLAQWVGSLISEREHRRDEATREHGEPMWWIIRQIFIIIPII